MEMRSTLPIGGSIVFLELRDVEAQVVIGNGGECFLDGEGVIGVEIGAEGTGSIRG